MEFEESDLMRVSSVVRENYPDVASRWEGIVQVISFAGCEFVFQNEWEDPCLISGSSEGDVILRNLHSLLTTR